jgi:hypothetical protein
MLAWSSIMKFFPIPITDDQYKNVPKKLDVFHILM